MANIIITIAAVITAVGTIAVCVHKIFQWFDNQDNQDKEIKKIKEEDQLLFEGLFACLDGLKQLGANGNVTKAHEKFKDYLNQRAHE